MWKNNKQKNNKTSNGMKKISFYVVLLIMMVNITLPASLFFVEKAEAVDACSITSASFNPSGEQPDDFYVEGSTVANIIFKTKNCVDQNIKLSIGESDGATTLTDDYWDQSGLYEKSIKVPTDNFTTKILLGEEDCETLIGGGLNYDCDLYFEVLNSSDNEIYNSFGKTGGNLFYECDTFCDDNGAFLGITPNGNNTTPTNIQAQTPQNINNNIYTPLAPIGDQTSIETNNVGSYFNTILKIAIAICGALAVIMIVIGGIQWMGDESVFGKTEAKSKITSAILGLIIALGAYALLNTIDPALIGSNGLNIRQVSANIESEETGVFDLDPNDTIPTEPVKDCKTKIKKITPRGLTIYACDDITKNNTSFADNLNLLIVKASKSQILLSGASFRSKERQEKFRSDNCGGSANIYNENAKCSPPTAIPGTSMHESGLAIDFKCDGKIMNVKKRPETKKCFDWLKNNAGTYGLSNLDSENWHWSTNGH